MCGQAKAQIGETEVIMELGYFGGELRIGAAVYTTDKRNINYPEDRRPISDPQAIHEALAPYTKSQIIDVMMCLVDSAEEAQ